jgi:hypothetical protein
MFDSQSLKRAVEGGQAAMRAREPLHPVPVGIELFGWPTRWLTYPHGLAPAVGAMVRPVVRTEVYAGKWPTRSIGAIVGASYVVVDTHDTEHGTHAGLVEVVVGSPVVATRSRTTRKGGKR